MLLASSALDEINWPAPAQDWGSAFEDHEGRIIDLERQIADLRDEIGGMSVELAGARPTETSDSDQLTQDNLRTLDDRISKLEQLERQRQLNELTR